MPFKERISGPCMLAEQSNLLSPLEDTLSDSYDQHLGSVLKFFLFSQDKYLLGPQCDGFFL